MRITDFLEPISQERELTDRQRDQMRGELMDAIESDRSRTTAGRSERRARRRMTAIAAVLLSMLTVGTAWALTRQPEQTTRILCPENLVTAAVSGDPVADCARVLSEAGIEPPAMAAYTNDQGAVTVVEVGADVPTGLQPLEDDFRQDVSIIEFEAALNDVTTGLDADCYSTEEALPIIDRTIADFGFEWTVDLAQAADGESTCAVSFLQPETSTVGLTAVEGSAPGDDQPWIALGSQLTTALDEQCLDLSQAASLVNDLAENLDMTEMMSISETEDEQAACTRATVTVGGMVFVDLRGPAAN
jgi:hypothetical protein